MPRRPLPLLVAGLLVVALAPGCADQTAPAVRIGDLTVSQDDLIAEVEAWAGSPTMLQTLQIEEQVGPPRTPGGSGYTMSFVDLVLTYRINFELHNEEFEALGLELSDAELQQSRDTLFADPNASAAALEELGDPYGEQLVADVTRIIRVQEELDTEYESWLREALTRDDIDVNRRFGRWDATNANVLPPEGPAPPPGEDVTGFG